MTAAHNAVQRAVKVVLEWHTWSESPAGMIPPGKTLAEIVAREISEAVREARERAFEEMMPRLQAISDAKDELAKRVTDLEKGREALESMVAFLEKARTP